MTQRKGSVRLRGLLEDLALFERMGERPSQAMCLAKIARLSVQQRDVVRAVRAVRFGLEAAEGDPELVGELWGIAGHALSRGNHLRAAIACYRRSERLFADAALSARAMGAGLAAAILIGTTDGAAARELLTALLDRAAGEAVPSLFATALVALGEIDLAAGDFGRADLCARTATEARRVAGLPASGADASLLGRALSGMGALDDARAALAQAVTLLEGEASSRLARALEELAWVELDRNAVEEARFALARVLLAARDGGDPELAARIGMIIASTFVDENASEALRYLAAAVDALARGGGSPSLLARAQELLELFPSNGMADGLLARVRGLLP